MALSGFLVPFVAGGITKALETRDEYDENAGNFVDAAAAKYGTQFDENQKDQKYRKWSKMKQNTAYSFFRIHLVVLCANFQLLTPNFDFGDFRRTFGFLIL